MGLVGGVLALDRAPTWAGAGDTCAPGYRGREGDYLWLDGELVAGLALGWNFGDGHLHDERLLEALQAQCGFEPGEVRCVFVESQPVQRQELVWRIADAATGEIARGTVSVAELREVQPWETIESLRARQGPGRLQAVNGVPLNGHGIPFHLAFPVLDLPATRAFYEGLLGCAVGRTDTRWVDFGFFGHQVSAHLVEVMPSIHTNGVDGDSVRRRTGGRCFPGTTGTPGRPSPGGWCNFLVEPRVRFAGAPGAATMFVKDPSGNALEFKSFRDPAKLFAVE